MQLVSLTLDGLTGVAQDHMRARFQTSANHMMLNINLWSTLVLGLGESNLPEEKLMCNIALMMIIAALLLNSNCTVCHIALTIFSGIPSW